MFNPEELKKSLFSLTRRGIHYELERMHAAASEAGFRKHAFSAIHVAGTNGKGSTCTYIESILRTAGYRTGLFTSPHIIKFEERFRINGEIISEDCWVAAYEKLQTVVEKYKLTFFEVTMLLALELFTRESVEWAVFETGMGGRLDATNILEPEVTVITSLSMDHADYLGSTLEEVASEKLGIVKASTPLVMALPHAGSLRELAERTCRNKNALLTFVSDSDAEIVSETVMQTIFRYNSNEFSIGMPGRFQVLNAMLALEAVGKLHCQVSVATLQQGLKNMRLDGRFELSMLYGKRIVFDVGHNPDAIRTLCTTLRKFFGDTPVLFVTGIMADKNYREMLEIIAQTANHTIVTRPEIERAAQPEILAACLPSHLCTVKPSVRDAVGEAFRRAEKVVCFTGSFYTVGEAASVIKTLQI